MSERERDRERARERKSDCVVVVIWKKRSASQSLPSRGPSCQSGSVSPGRLKQAPPTTRRTTAGEETSSEEMEQERSGRETGRRRGETSHILALVASSVRHCSCKAESLPEHTRLSLSAGAHLSLTLPPGTHIYIPTGRPVMNGGHHKA